VFSLLQWQRLSTESTALYTAGTYSASSPGHSSDVTVTAEFDDSSITSVTIDASGETESIGGAAVDTLQQEILDAQSAEIDTVFGATETSNAVIRAMEDVIAQAEGTSVETSGTDKTAVADGTYTESVQSFGFTGDMVGEVTFKDNAITNINITSETDSLTDQ
jgi:uncharacterized protein with FMN-binding domain